MQDINLNTTLVNYKTDGTSISDLFYSQTTEIADNLFYTIKSDLIIDYSVKKLEKSKVNKEPETEILEE